MWDIPNTVSLGEMKGEYMFTVWFRATSLAKVNCNGIRTGNLDIPFLPKVIRLCVILDAELTVVQAGARVMTGRGRYRLRQIGAIRKLPAV